MQNNASNVSLRCFIYPGENNGRNGYYGICLDLCLITWRPTSESAKGSLEQAICGYLEVQIKDKNIQSFEEFRKIYRNSIRRPAPFFPYWYKYLIALFLPRLFGKVNKPQIYNPQLQHYDFCFEAG